MNLFEHLLNPASWSGPEGIPARLVEHLLYSGASLALAILIALPLGILIGHTRRGNVLVAGLANATRALPTLGLLVLVVLLLGTGAIPVILALTVLAIPPILNATVVGFRTADPDAVLAAAAMGMTGGQQVAKVELPLASPLIISGIRSAALQVIATATVAAMAASGGLGRYVLDGQKRADGYPEMITGALLVMVLALLADLLLGGLALMAQRRTTGRRKVRTDLFDEANTGPDSEGASA
ncbi:ABC transporter permease [Granulicoccus sp. GXG6511]|uniref:ABC transporter permease n=1 Tax=Granulicoccus sp. GXG6511 TaxID=3381351 RepID=UPI003D7D33CA